MFACEFCGFRFESSISRDDHVDYVVANGLIDADSR